jgi:hypothetical protein
MLVAVRREVVVDLPAAQQNLGDLRSLVETACLARRSDFGVKMISGRVRRLNTCQRRRWKYDAGVLGIATVMLS